MYKHCPERAVGFIFIVLVLSLIFLVYWFSKFIPNHVCKVEKLCDICDNCGILCGETSPVPMYKIKNGKCVEVVEWWCNRKCTRWNTKYGNRE